MHAAVARAAAAAAARGTHGSQASGWALWGGERWRRSCVQVISQLQNIFTPEPKLIKSRINDLIEREYLERKEGDPTKYVVQGVTRGVRRVLVAVTSRACASWLVS